MSSFTTANYRRLTGYIRLKLNPRRVEVLTTSSSVDEELWVILQYYSEIREVGVKFIKARGVTNPAKALKVYRHFQAYIRQAKNYYYSAKALAPRSASLLYYYCFLNLAKAAVVISDPSMAGKKIKHGLESKTVDISKLSSQRVSVKKDGVFPRLYSWWFGSSLRPITLSIQPLFRYCTDISYQYETAGYGKHKVLYSMYSHCVDKDKRIAWALLAIPGAQAISNYPKTLKNFIHNFERVEMPQLSCREIFNLSALEQHYYTFLQGKNVTMWAGDNYPSEREVTTETLRLLEPVFQTSYVSKGGDFAIALPYLKNRQIRVDEPISIYLIMYYLSNLTRYNPQYLEGLLSEKSSWLVDSFIRFCPVTFLRAIVSRIVGTDYTFEPR